MKLFGLTCATGALMGAFMFAGAASAAPMMATGIGAGDIAPAHEIVQVQNRRNFGGNNRGFARPVARGGGGGFARGGGRGFARGRGIGPGGAAAIIGLGLVGRRCSSGRGQLLPASADPRSLRLRHRLSPRLRVLIERNL